ncbi:hypothetical protein ABPG75_002010 [Micractinium tetrahymenae]
MAAPQLAAGALLARAGGNGGYLKLDLVSTTDSADPIAFCGTSIKVNIAADCKVWLTPISSGCGWVPGIWTGDDPRTYDRYIQCPIDNTDALAPASGADYNLGAAIQTAFEGFVYGYAAGGSPKRPMTIDSVAYTPGKVTFMRGPTTLVYAITESTIDAAQVDAGIVVVAACSDMDDPLTQCRDFIDASSYPEGLATACGLGSYGLTLEDQWGVGYAKLCLLCPPGTYGDGWGCTACPAGGAEPSVGAQPGPACAAQCGPGTYSPSGSSTCLPCLPGTYSDQPSNSICTQCPVDSNNWLPGSITCLRCIKGVPYECKADAGTCDDPASPGTPLGPSSPGSHILSVDTMASCALAGTYEVKAYTQCGSWANGGAAGQALQFAFEVAGDCAIDILPITDPTCAEPLSQAAGYSYGELQMRAFYDSTTTIRSLLASDLPTSTYMVGIDVNGADLEMRFWAASTDPGVDPPPDTCLTTLHVVGGQVAGLPDAVPSPPVCPPGSYYVANDPTGYTCPGGTGTAAVKTPCAAETANPIYGLGDACPRCDTAHNGGYTSYDGAAYCDVHFPDRWCNDTTLGYEFNYAHKKCVHTAGDDANRTCLTAPQGPTPERASWAWPSACPALLASSGLGDQEPVSKVTGQHCLVCPEGSLALTDAWAASTIADDADMPTGATLCDACPGGTYQGADRTRVCQPCPSFPTIGVWTYRTGDATPENNECKPVPSGYKLVDANLGAGILPNTKITLCEAGAVSFWNAGGTVRTPPDPLACAPCSSLDGLLGTAKYANTYAPRRGMMSCIPVPAGYVPKDNAVTGGTDSYEACPDGQYRDAYTISNTCVSCGLAGR